MILALAMVSAAFPAVAFDGAEHRAISNAALALVSQSAPPDLRASALALSFEQTRRTFGDLTRMVDWYQDPGKFARLPSWTAIEGRQRFGIGKVKHLIAIHHNDSHFQDDAARAYDALHRCALASVKTSPETALWYEAFALHYLQDFFAPGHIVSPRARNDDAAAAGLHDQFNKKGADVSFFTDARQAFKEKLETIASPGSFIELRAALDSGRSTRFYGDGKLGSSEQFQFLAALSALSIRELFVAATIVGDEVALPGLSLCFVSRSGLADGNDSYPIPVIGQFHGPFAAAAIPGAGENCKCERGALARFDFEGREELAQRFYSPSVWKVSTFAGTHGQVWYDLGAVVLSYDPSGRLRMRHDDNECVDQTFRPYLNAESSFHASYLAGAGYSAVGAHLQLGQAWRWLSAFGYLGGRRYAASEVREYRPYLGLKLVAGFEIVNVIVGVERAHRLNAGGFDPRYMLLGGAELNIPQSWISTAADKIRRR